MHYRFTQTSIWRACRWKSIINCNLDCLTPSMDHTARHSFGWMLMLQCRLSISSSNASQLAFWSAIQNYATCATALHTLSQTFLPASRVCIMIGKRESERERENRFEREPLGKLGALEKKLNGGSAVFRLCLHQLYILSLPGAPSESGRGV